MEHNKSIGFVTLVLTSVAGYCDTATFVAGKGIFSAHVTGNFIVFAAQVVSGQDAAAYIKLLSFPVFILAVITGGWMIRRQYPVLLMQGIVLLLSGLTACVWLQGDKTEDVGIYSVVMLAVFAMGLQNAFGRIFAKATHGPTTMMTGNVTQAALDLGNIIAGRGSDAITARFSLKKVAVTIGGFLLGCILGALLGSYWGLASLLVPGIAMLLCYLTTAKNAYIVIHE